MYDCCFRTNSSNPCSVGLTDMASGIASGLNAMATDLFITTDATNGTQSLSTFGGIVAIFGGIALAVGLTTLVTKWIMSLGARN